MAINVRMGTQINTETGEVEHYVVSGIVGGTHSETHEEALIKFAWQVWGYETFTPFSIANIVDVDTDE